jgi:hypothetical protein
LAGSIPAASGRIFISYRREETAYPAGWLYERLADRFGTGQVFKDVDSIQLGDDFVEVITRAVGSCDVLLALMGDEWLTITDEHGRRRLDDPDDFVRLEIEAALSRRVRVIPILVDGATMPRADELPDSLAKLVRRQALELSPSRFEFDTSRLLKVLETTLAEVRTAQEDTASKVAAAGEDTASKVAAAEEAPDPSTAEVQASPEPRPRDRDEPRGKPGGRLPARARILAAAGVVVVLVLAGVVVASSRNHDGRPGTSAARGGIAVDSTPVSSGDGIKLTGLKAEGQGGPPSKGDTITVSYSLTNVGSQPLRLAATFVGARNEAGDHRDSEQLNLDRTLAPGETVATQGRVVVDSAGRWRLWPCYELGGGTTCPDEWQAFPVVVG